MASLTIKFEDAEEGGFHVTSSADPEFPEGAKVGDLQGAQRIGFESYLSILDALTVIEEAQGPSEADLDELRSQVQS